MLPEYLKKKVDFVKELSDVYSKYQRNVERIDYVVFKTTADYDGKREFLIITYVGGGRTIKLVDAKNSGFEDAKSITIGVTQYIPAGAFAIEVALGKKKSDDLSFKNTLYSLPGSR